MISERLALMLEEAERRVNNNGIVCRGDPDHMTKEQIDREVKRARDEMIVHELDKMLRGLL